MKQRCDDAYWEGMENVLARNGDPKNPGKPCGRAFDDLDHSTICPHEELGTEGLICKEMDLYKSVCPHYNPKPKEVSNAQA